MRTRFIFAVVVLGFLLAAGLLVFSQQGESSSESTGAPAGAPVGVHLAAVGDIGATPEAGALLSRVAALDPDVFMVLGDLSYLDDPETEWCDFVTNRVGGELPVQLLAGNHESDGYNGLIDNFANCLPDRLRSTGEYAKQYYYDLPAEDPVVRVVNTSAGLTFPDGTWSYARGDSRYQWTVDAIDGARASDIPWVIVNNHLPCMGVSEHVCEMPPDFLDLLLTKNVDLVLMGHDHAYSRTHQLALDDACSGIVPDEFNEACISDAEAPFTSGAGTVFATVGTGGIPLRNVSTEDPEYPYFAAVSGKNLDPAWGVLDLHMDAKVMDVSFVRSEGVEFFDSFRLTKPGVDPKTATQPATGQKTGPRVRSATPVADTYSHELVPDEAYGDTSSLMANGAPEIASFLRFPAQQAPPGASLVRAELIVETTDQDSAGSADTFEVRTVDDEWDEATLTFPDSPPRDGITVGRLSAPKNPGTVYPIDLDVAELEPLLAGGVSLSIVGTGGDDALEIWSRDATKARPLLTLTYE